MTFLPMVERELRAASRRKSTYRIRSWTAVLAILVSFFSLIFIGLVGGRATMGTSLFTNLTGYAFGLCLLAGVFLTADSLSEEKREGTLGLLFLTDLHVYDVVLGKFAAAFIGALYGLLALLPVIGIPLLLGGVTAGEFWRTAIALVNALFVSLAAGIWVSALVRDGQRAMVLALGLIVFLVAGLPGIASLGSLSLRSEHLSLIGAVSPFYPFYYARAILYFSHAGKFWGTLAASQALGWMLLLLASRTLPRQWQEGTRQNRPFKGLDRFARGWQQTSENRTQARRALLPINPILWLINSEPAFRRLAWVVVLTCATLILSATILARSDVSTFALGWYGVRPFAFLLKALFAVQACRFFAEARRNGALEMLLTTPDYSRDYPRPIARVAPRVSRTRLGLYRTAGLGIFVSGITAVRMIADFFALFWFGLWSSLTMKRPNFAPAVTILAVLILPSALCWLDILADLIFVLWGATKLQQDLRWVLAQQYQVPRSPIRRPVPLSTPPGVPPVIAR